MFYKIFGYYIYKQMYLNIPTVDSYNLKFKYLIYYSTVWKNVKYLGINLTKYMKDVCTKNYKILLGEIKGDLSNWKDVLCMGWKS